MAIRLSPVMRAIPMSRGHRYVPGFRGRFVPMNPVFQQRHYEKLAVLMKQAIEHPDGWGDISIAFRLCRGLLDDNPAFKPEVFLRACGYDEERVKAALAELFTE